MRDLTERDVEILDALSAYPTERWVLPMDVGGHDGSHHSATLQKLIRRGLVERKPLGGWARQSYRYRLTAAGRAGVARG